MQSTIVTIILVLSISVCSGQAPQIEWEVNLGGSDEEMVSDVLQTSDNGFLIVGSTKSTDGLVSGFNGGTQYDYWVIKLDQNGSLQWQTCLGGTSNDKGFDLIPGIDGGYVILGESVSSDGDINSPLGHYDIWLVKLDDTGQIVWEKSYGSSIQENGRSIAYNNNNGYVIGGYHYPNSSLELNAYAISVDQSGNLLWQQSYGNMDNDWFNSVTKVSGGGTVLAGRSNPANSSGADDADGDFYVVKISDWGFAQWTYYFGGSNLEAANHVDVTVNGDLLLAGTSKSNDGDLTVNHGYTDMWFLRINDAGSIVWGKTIGTQWDDGGSMIQELSNGNILILGDSPINENEITGNHGSFDYWLGCLDANGNFLWGNSYGGSLREHPEAFIVTNDGGVLIVGTSESSDGDVNGNYGLEDIWAVKLGPVTSTEETKTEAVELVKITDLLGREVEIFRTGLPYIFYYSDGTSKLEYRIEK